MAYITKSNSSSNQEEAAVVGVGDLGPRCKAMEVALEVAEAEVEADATGGTTTGVTRDILTPPAPMEYE
eukprot:CAMPEP_0114360780 /NCGR_PEP_ID=MMETSP0101-20121206/24124_1 /TAXON_ID=38822 ORGANISM="Pteridomonas danica, Strain PT" /NCGR_SAMPLE_ID=MMETSP0101 /ASSEMBLY_ACC=CAM_ASM_000211 /LENGTH=68 /DNA_ID=CAMNT_0001505195 /DNA_START=35 /DNA_END=238 /DNA_ORIENTATION=+